jgi:hypothetical protein
MQHLLIHLPYEAKVGGPVQYRWMYHIERAIIYLKPKVSNRARVEGCIAETFILKEVAYSQVFTLQRNIMSMLQRCGTMPMKNLLVATYPFYHQGAQLLVVARAVILPQKKGMLPYYTCMLT